MPELPEVVVVTRSLNNTVANKEIKNIIILRPKMIKEITINEFKSYLIGNKINCVKNVGKNIVFHISNHLYLLSHLRMEGKYFYYQKHHKIEKNVHIIFEFTDGSELHYKDTRVFGTFHIRDNNYLNVLPISLLANEPKDTNYKEFFKVIKNKNRYIKTLLIDQSILVGLGNIYVDEVLFESKVNPLRRTNTITLNETRKIINNSIKILDKSIECGGTTVSTFTSLNSSKGTFQDHLKVYGRKNEKCYYCNNTILKTKVNGRGTHYCKKCQPLD